MSYCDIILLYTQRTAPPNIFTLYLHDALPISIVHRKGEFFSCRHTEDLPVEFGCRAGCILKLGLGNESGIILPDRKSTRLNSSHTVSSYAVFCLKKKKKMLTRQVG